MKKVDCLSKVGDKNSNPGTNSGTNKTRVQNHNIETIHRPVMTETANWNVDSETGSLESMGSDVQISGLNNGSGDPPCAAPKCSELEETANPEVNTSVSEMGNFESKSIPCLGMSSVDATTSSGREDPPCAAPKSSELEETANPEVNTSVSEMGNFDFMDSESKSYPLLGNEVRRCDDVFWKGDPPSAAPKSSELEETANPEVNTSVSEMGNFDFMDSESKSIPCLGMSSVDATTSSGREDPPCAAPKSSELEETANPEVNTIRQ